MKDPVRGIIRRIIPNAIRTHISRIRKGVPEEVTQTEFALQLGEADRPFFVVGSGRCGTTLVRRMLMAGGRVFLPPENYVLPRIVRRYGRAPALPWPEFVSYAIGQFENHEEWPAWEFSLTETAAALRDLPTAEQSVARIIHEVFQGYARSQSLEARRWGDKTPFYVSHLPCMQQLFPHAKFVHLVRDGVDVVSSILEMDRPGFGLVEAAHRWTTALEAFRQFQQTNASHCIEVRYEDLVNNPEVTLRNLCEFIELSFDPSMTASTDVPRDVAKLAHHANLRGSIDNSKVGKGRNKLTPTQRNKLQRLIGQTLHSFGYPPAI